MAAAQKLRDTTTVAVKRAPMAEAPPRLKPSYAPPLDTLDRYCGRDLAFDEPQIQRYPPLVRVAIIGGTSALFWFGVVMAAKAAFRL